MSLDDFSDVTVTQEGPPLTAVGFGTLGLAAYVPVAHMAEYSRTYASTTEAAADFLTDSAPYRMLQRAFQQEPRLGSAKILRCEHAPVCTYTITPIAANSVVYALTVDVERPASAIESAALIKHTVSVTSDGTATVDEICDALAAALAGVFDPADLTITPDGGTATKLTLTTTGTGRMFWVSDFDTTRLKVVDTTADPGMSADLDAIQAHDADWYGFTTAVSSVAAATAAATWTEAQTKVYIPVTSDWAAANDGTSTTDLQPALKTLGYKRTLVAFKKSGGSNYMGAADLGERLPFDPGAAPFAGGTFTAKQIKGVGADSLTSTQKGILKTKGYQLCESTAGITHTLGGRAANGTPLDQTRFVDWFRIRLQEDVATAELNSGKIPNDARGRAQIEGIARARIAAGQAAGGIGLVNPAGQPPTVVVPPLSASTPTDRANRVLRNVQIGFYYTGAIESVEISVNVEV